MSYGPRLLSLRVKNLRNLRSLTLETDGSGRALRVAGSNGAGKTSVLEAVYLLARGKTFRGRHAGPITSFGESQTLIEGRFLVGPHLEELDLTFRRQPVSGGLQINGVAMPAKGPQESPLTVKLVSENPQALLEGEPRLRRALLDWNLFHVEPSVGRLRSELRRIVSQRNACLRSRHPDTGPWDPLFVSLAQQITLLRETFFTLWRGAFGELADQFPFLQGAELYFDRGWPIAEDLSQLLLKGRPSDVQRGQTQIGPHRADFTIRRGVSKLPFSRGQAKVVTCLLQLAAERVHRDFDLAPSLWLLDDLTAELDERTSEHLQNLLALTGAQCLFTCPTPPSRPVTQHGRPNADLFTIDQGVARFEPPISVSAQQGTDVAMSPPEPMPKGQRPTPG